MGKTKLMIFFIVFCLLFQSCLGQGIFGGSGELPTEQTYSAPWLIIFNGESNSGGMAPNTSALANELDPQAKTKILNNINFTLEQLDIGSNNLLLHVGLENYDSSSHGFELGISDRINTDATFKDTAYLCKTGIGGSRISQWLVRTKINNIYYPELDYFYTFSNRVNRIKNILDSTGLNYRTAIFLSIGINDALASTNVDSFHNRMINHINYMRLITGSQTPVVITKFTSVAYPSISIYNAEIDEITTELDDVYSVNSTPNMSNDGLHWNYSEMKIMANRMMDILKNNY